MLVVRPHVPPHHVTGHRAATVSAILGNRMTEDPSSECATNVAAAPDTMPSIGKVCCNQPVYPLARSTRSRFRVYFPSQTALAVGAPENAPQFGYPLCLARRLDCSRGLLIDWLKMRHMTIWRAEGSARVTASGRSRTGLGASGALARWRENGVHRGAPSQLRARATRLH